MEDASMKELKMTPKILTWGIRRLNRTLSWERQELLVVKNLPDHVGDIRDPSLIPGSGRSPGGQHSNPLQYSCLENPMDRRGWWATVHRVTKSWTLLKWLSTHAFTCLRRKQKRPGRFLVPYRMPISAVLRGTKEFARRQSDRKIKGAETRS